MFVCGGLRVGPRRIFVCVSGGSSRLVEGGEVRTGMGWVTSVREIYLCLCNGSCKVE